MASQVDIADLALSILGKGTIASLGDQSNAARVINVEYDLIRRALLRGRPTWSFSVARASLPAMTAVPVSGPFTQQLAMPTDCLRVLLVGDVWPGLDLSDYRLGPTDSGYTIEGRNILCDYAAPVPIKYVKDVTDTTLFDPWFCIYLAAQLAWTCCERLTNSDTKQAAAKERKSQALTEAAASNALEKPPENTADDSWVAARMQ